MLKPRVVTRTEDVVHAMKEAREAKGWTHNDADDYAGLCHGFASKLEAPDRKWGRGGFFMGFPIFCLLEAVGLRVVVMPIDDAEELVKAGREDTTRNISLLKRDGRIPVKMERSICAITRSPKLSSRNL